MKKKSTSRRDKSGLTEVLIPMHADNWALSLASGYVGPGLNGDHAVDAQSNLTKHIIAFRGSVPRKMIMEGPQVILSAMVKIEGHIPKDGLLFLDDYLRTTSVKVARFDSEDAIRNFIASYSLFPDVPVTLVPFAVGGYDISLLEPELPAEPSGLITGKGRLRLEYFGGWAAGIVKLLSEGKFDLEIQRYLSIAKEGFQTPFTAACSLLDSFHKDASQEDRAIWGSVVEVIAEKASQRGFDREVLLAEVAKRALERMGDDSEIVRNWVDTCEKVIRATIEPPALDDRKRIGQRAALGAILAPDCASASSLGITMEAGPRVHALVSVVAQAFEGLSRVPSRSKADPVVLSAIQDIGEALEKRVPVAITFMPRTIDRSLKVIDRIIVSNREAIRRELAATPYELLMIEKLGENIGLCVTDHNQVSIFMDDDSRPILEEEPSRSSSDLLRVRMYLPVLVLGSRSTAQQFRSFLESAWASGCSVGLHEIQGNSHLIAFQTVPMHALTQEVIQEVANTLRSLFITIRSQYPEKPKKVKETRGRAAADRRSKRAVLEDLVQTSEM